MQPFHRSSLSFATKSSINLDRRPRFDSRRADCLVDLVEGLYTAHYRSRVECDKLLELAHDPYRSRSIALADDAIEFLSHELPGHVAFGLRGFRAALRARCRPSDDVESILERLARNHAEDSEAALDLMADLRRLATGGRLRSACAFKAMAASLARRHREHVVWENCMVMPLARRRLTVEDRIGLGPILAARRSHVAAA